MGSDMKKKRKQTEEQINTQRFLSERKQLVASHKRDMLLCVGVFAIATLASFFFKNMASDPSLNIAMLYTLGVFLITR